MDTLHYKCKEEELELRRGCLYYPYFKEEKYECL